MSGFPPAFVAIRRQLRRARLLALCGGLSWAGPAAAQVPSWSAEEEDTSVVPAPPVAPSPPEPAPAPIAPEPAALESSLGPPPKDATAEASGNERETHVPLRYTLEA